MTVLLRLSCCLLLAAGLSAADPAPVPPPAADSAPAPVAASEQTAPAPPTSDPAAAAPTAAGIQAPAAASAPAANAPASTAPAASASAPRTDDFPTVTIANAKARVVLTAQRASIVRFELLDSHPVSLPEPLRQHMGLPKDDGSQPRRDQPLAVLDDFRRDAQRHEWNRHNFITLDNTVGPNLDGTVDRPWQLERSGPDHATFRLDLRDRGLSLEMSYQMDPKRPTVTTRLSLRNTGAAAVTLQPRVLAVNGIHQDYSPTEVPVMVGAYHVGGERGELTATSLPSDEGAYDPEGNKPAYDMAGLDYIAVKSRFFAVLFAPQNGSVATAGSAEIEPGPGGAPSANGSAPGPALRFRFQRKYMRWPQPLLHVYLPEASLAPGASTERVWSLTATSVREDDLASLSVAEHRIKYTDGMYRFFKVLADGLIWCLGIIWLGVRNYGLAVIVLTFLLKLLLHRFTFKQQASMLKMQKLAPQLKLLQERHKSDKQKLGLETMALYKKEGVNPLSGCLPLLIQLPMFMALYQAFNHSADMRGQSFLWINDLTLPDPIWAAPGWFSWLSINPLALIYIGTTVWMSFHMKPPPTTDPQQEQIQKMMRWLPVIFGIIFYHMPAGLVLYFTVNAILSTIEIRLVKRKLGIE